MHNHDIIFDLESKKIGMIKADCGLKKQISTLKIFRKTHLQNVTNETKIGKNIFLKKIVKKQ